VNKKIISGITDIISTTLAYNQPLEITGEDSSQKNLLHEKTPIRAKYWSIT